MPTARNKRREDRVSTALPVRLGKASGVTRDVSASGISFEVDTGYETGSEVSFVIELQNGTETMLMNCKGSIVRTEDHGKKKTVAVKLTEAVMHAMN